MKYLKLSGITEISELTNNELMEISGGRDFDFDLGWSIGYIGGLIQDAAEAIAEAIAELPPSTLYD